MKKIHFSKKFTVYAVIAVIIIAALIIAVPKYANELGIRLSGGSERTFSLKDNGLSVFFADVGQGDCTVIVTPDGKCMMIDAGPPECAASICGLLDGLDIGSVDILVLTHPHGDHTGSADTIIEKYDIGTVFVPPLSYSGSEYESALRAAYESGVEIQTVRACERFSLGEYISFEVLSPMREVYDTENDQCIVIRMEYGDTVFMFPADSETTALSDLVTVYGKEKLRSDVLKSPHHGSGGSACEDFIKAVSPGVTVISCGYGNEYGHPHVSVLDLLDKYSRTVLRTDLCGTVYVFSDGDTVSVQTEK